VLIYPTPWTLWGWCRTDMADKVTLEREKLRRRYARAITRARNSSRTMIHASVTADNLAEASRACGVYKAASL